MKNKVLFGTMLALLLVGSVSFADDDADKKRLLEEYDKMQAEKAKEAERLAKENPQATETTEVVGENGEVVVTEGEEVAGYYEIMGEEKARPSIMDEQKAEVTEQASPAEVSQEAAPAEANAQEKAVEQTSPAEVPQEAAPAEVQQ